MLHFKAQFLNKRIVSLGVWSPPCLNPKKLIPPLISSSPGSWNFGFPPLRCVFSVSGVYFCNYAFLRIFTSALEISKKLIGSERYRNRAPEEKNEVKCNFRWTYIKYLKVLNKTKILTNFSFFRNKKMYNTLCKN